jgi:MFS family permease
VSPDPARAALATPAFRRLTAAWALTNIADSLLLLILAVWVMDLTGSPAAGGLTLALVGAPALVSPLLGQVADRVSRRRMMAVAYLVGAASLLPLFLVGAAGPVGIVLGVTVVYATVGYATTAAQSGLLRDLLPDEALAAANGRFTAIDQSFRLVMPFVGAAVYAVTGPKPLVVVASVGFALASIVVRTVAVQETSSGPRTVPFLHEAAEGFRHLWATPPLPRLTIAMVVAVGSTGLINAVAFAILEALGVPAHMLGPVVAVQGLFAVIAGVLASRIIRRLGAVVAIAGGLGLVGVGLVPTLGSSIVLVVAVGMPCIGFGMTIAIIAFMTERQLLTPSALQGRVTAATMLLITVPQVGLTLVGAALLGLVDYRILVLVNLVGVLAAVPVALRGRVVTGVPRQARRRLRPAR